MELYKLKSLDLAKLIKAKEVSAVEATKATLARIEAVEPKVDAFITVCGEEALKKAEAVDKKIAAGEPVSKLAGVPVSVKDNFCTNGILTTCASKMLYNFVPPYSAHVVEKMDEADIILVGKANLDEFAMGSSCENSYFKPTKNPWDTTRIPGGSSGGSAASVAAGMVPFSLGSDTGGSVRLPAALCGVVGLKPTYGSVSRYGVVAFASSFDQVGPIGRTTDDLEALFEVISGRDKRDATSKDYVYKRREGGLQGLTIGIPKQYFGEGISAEVKAAVYAGIEQLKKLGAKTVEVSLPSADYALSAYYIISSAEASSNLARFDGVRYGYATPNPKTLNDLYELSRSEGFGDEVKRRIMLGTYVLSSGFIDAYYKKAKALQRLVKQEYEAAFKTCDVIVTPIAPTTAAKIGEKSNDPLAMYAGDICTVTLNMTGLPGISIPCGFGAGELPIGMQVIGRRFEDNRLIQISREFETAVGGFKVKEI